MIRRTYYCGIEGLVRKYNHETDTWSVVSLPIGNGNKKLYDIMCFPNQPDKVVTVGDGNNAIWLSIDEGASWSHIGANLLITDYIFEEVWLLNDGTSDWIFVCGRNATTGNAILVKSFDDGATWTVINNFDSTNTILFRTATAVHFYDQNIGVIVLSGNAAGSLPFYIAYTINGGSSWTITNGGLPIQKPDINSPALWSYGINIVPQSIGGYRIVASTAEGIIRSIDSGNTYTYPFLYTSFLGTNRIGRHLTWYGQDTYWATDLTGGVIQSIDGGVNWVIALPFYVPGTQPNDQQKLGAHFYSLDNTTNRYIGFITQDEAGATPVPISGCYQVESSSIATPFPSNVSAGATNNIVSIDSLTAVWTETYLASCVRLTECNGTKELYMQDVTGPNGNLLSTYVGQYIQVSYTCNENPCPELYGTDGFPICWKVEEVIPNCVGTLIPEGQVCFELVIT